MNKYSLLLMTGVLVLAGAGCAPNETPQDNSGPNDELEATLGITPEQTSDMNYRTNLALFEFTAPPITFPGVLRDEDRLNRQVTIKTNKGDVTLELFGDESPLAVSNFLVLANTGFYDDVIFHRVIKGFMIQGGDPQGTGTGGPGYKFEDELGHEYTQYPPGTLAMANSGPNTNGSQFFIMQGDVPLPNDYTIFGQVVDGQDVVDAIADVAVNANDKPDDDVVISTIEIK